MFKGTPEKYKLNTINVGRLFLVLLITGIILHVDIYILIQLIESGTKMSPAPFILMILAPVLIVLIWLLTQKFKDIIVVSEQGLDSQLYGFINWDELKFCSWESHRGEYLFIKLKNGKRLLITPVSSQRLTDDNLDDH